MVVNEKRLANYNNQEFSTYLDKENIILKYYIDTENKKNDLIYQKNSDSFDIVIQQIQDNNFQFDTRTIMSLTNDDLIEDGRSLTIEELTKEYLQIISQAITSYRVKQDCPITKNQVIFNNQPLFCIKTFLNRQSPQQRVKKIQQQIDKINQGIIPLDSLSIVKVSNLNKIIGLSQHDSLMDNEENPSIAIISQTEEWISYKNQVVMIITNEDAKLIGDGKVSTFTLANNYFLKIKEAVENDNPEEAWVTFNFGGYNFFYQLYNWLFKRNKIQLGRIYHQTYSDLLANIQDNCRKHNIELVSPHYQVNRLTQDGESSVVPSF